MSPVRIDALSRSLADGTSRRRLLGLLGAGIAGSAVTAIGLHESQAKNNKNKKNKKQRKAKTKGPKYLVEGHDAAGTVVFTGTLALKKFVATGQGITDIHALGQVTGTIEKNGKSKKVTRGVSVPVVTTFAQGAPVQAQQNGECQVLNLQLGPIFLNLLGLEVTIEGQGGVPIIIDLTADPSGGLLGQLLCGLAGGLPIPGVGDAIQQIIDILNDLLAILG